MNQVLHRYFAINKPFHVLSQFSPEKNLPASGEVKRTLKDFFKVPPDVYPVGRLDYDSEGLLLLTNDKSLNAKLLGPSQAHEREYWVQVEGVPDSAAISSLIKGVTINTDGRVIQTLPAQATLFNSPPVVAPRNPPIRERKNVPDSWISLTLTEGRNRQVRKMTAAVGFPTLRLIRYRIERVTLDGIGVGELLEFSRKELERLLFNKF